MRPSAMQTGALASGIALRVDSGRGTAPVCDADGLACLQDRAPRHTVHIRGVGAANLVHRRSFPL
jgi:hypothetical protein